MIRTGGLSVERVSSCCWMDAMGDEDAIDWDPLGVLVTGFRGFFCGMQVQDRIPEVDLLGQHFLDLP